MARFLWSSALFLSVLQVSVSKPIVKRWDDFQVKHSWEDVPRGWELVGPAPADYNLHMKIGLKQDRMHELIDHLYQVSDPAHNRYVPQLQCCSDRSTVVADMEHTLPRLRSMLLSLLILILSTSLIRGLLIMTSILLLPFLAQTQVTGSLWQFQSTVPRKC